MYKYKFLSVILLQLLAITINVKAQQPRVGKDVGNSKALSAYISGAVAKSYDASVLMWEIDAESGNRMSAQFSGVVVSNGGEILSAAHVVTPGKTYKVTFPDGKECTARGLGRISIPPTFMLPDAAMLKIVDKGPWPFAVLGWSSSLTVGQPCISIAYPESLEQRRPNVRFGHISVLKNKHGFVQSTCIMEPGDSGGPLFDLLGRVIGIHSGIEVPEDINYEIPVDTYRKYWNALSRAENYTSLPADTDAFTGDAQTMAIAVIPSVNSLSAIFNKAAIEAKLSCVKIKSLVDGKQQLILGTAFLLDGNAIKKQFSGKTVLLSKSSMVGEDPTIVLANGQTIGATIIARNRANDLALLLPAKNIGKGIKYSLLKADSITFNDLGRLLIAPRPDSSGRVSVLGSMLIKLPKITSYGYIGAVTNIKADDLVFTYIQPNSAAEAAGLKIDDQVLTVDGHTADDPLDFIKALQKYRAGDTTVVGIMRNGKKYIKAVVLKYPPQKVFNHPAEQFAGGKSLRRDGFDRVFINDAPMKPYECGGPLFDDRGYFRGINIARLSRTSTVTIPAVTIKQFLHACTGIR
jgi:serine protease Do